MTELKNEIIRASAGTGKTHALVRRYLWLLAHGATPEQIAAMTFTRKAAGEFFGRILQGLAEIAEHPERARGYVEELTAGKSLELLRTMLGSMDRLRLGTIDSFFATMAQSLPFELGLSGKPDLMSEEDAVEAREEVLDELLLTVSKMSDQALLDELRESWKDASHGAEQGKPAETLLKWISAMHQLFVECPDSKRWGDESVIWPQGNEKIARAGLNLSDAAAVLEGALDTSSWQNRAVEKWNKFFDELRTRQDADKIKGNTTEYMLEDDRVKNDPGGFDRLRIGGVKWFMWKDVVLDRTFGAALADALDATIGRSLRVRCRRTAELFKMLRLYEAIYHRKVRSRGRLVFSDLGWLLSGRLRTTGTEAAAWRERWNELRTALDFRMSARHDHWLLDEFQDTSERQWEVLAPLLDEARQDAEHARSVFLVGDMKQSIYLWRQAEPELFKHVEKAWKDERLELRPLNESHRSCPEVIEMVNKIFFNAENELETRFPGVRSYWSYDKHVCSAKVSALKGHAAMLCVPKNDDSEEDISALAVSALIRRIDPVARGLSCGVLVRTNKTARALSHDLRRLLGMEVICETEETVTVDNPATLVLLSLFHLAAHPDDTLAWGHLQMTPLGIWLSAEKLTRQALSGIVRRAVAEEGFLSVSREWAEKLKQAIKGADAFTERRLAQFFELAADFDATGSRDVEAFLRRAREHRVREDAASARAIQVMTVHQSKGLQFDVVIMPELQGSALDNVARNRIFISRGGRGAVEWILDKPEQVAVQRDEVLREALKREKARQAFEGLCRLYVGVTRAKLGIYLIAADGKKNTSNNEADILRARIGDGKTTEYSLNNAAVECLWECGSRSWFEEHKMLSRETAPPPVTTTPDLGALLRKVNPAITRRTPSGEESFRIKGRDLLSPERDRGRLLGNVVHELFAAVPWLEAAGEAGAIAAWKEKRLDQTPEYGEAARLVLTALRDEEIKQWFEPRGQQRVAWVERRFDMLQDGEWISGQLDRVVLERGKDGGFTSAMILDFKTDQAADESTVQEKMKGYAPQIALYKNAVSRLSGLAREKICAALIFTSRPMLRMLGG